MITFDKLIQVLIFLTLVTMPLWSGKILGLDRNGPYLEDVDHE